MSTCISIRSLSILHHSTDALEGSVSIRTLVFHHSHTPCSCKIVDSTTLDVLGIVGHLGSSLCRTEEITEELTDIIHWLIAVFEIAMLADEIESHS